MVAPAPTNTYPDPTNGYPDPTNRYPEALALGS
jgi:hypothetical protein